MPVNVYNRTSGRDEENVFGANTTRQFGTIGVPSIEEFGSLKGYVEWLEREHAQIVEKHEGLAKRLTNIKRQMLERETAQRMVEEIKQAVADTATFTAALNQALAAHEQRLRGACEQSRQAVETLREQTHAETLSAQACLATQRQENTVASTQRAESIAEFKAIEAAIRQEQEKTQNHASAAEKIRQNMEQDYAALIAATSIFRRLKEGGFITRLSWLFRGGMSRE